jgi:hypothetical protein
VIGARTGYAAARAAARACILEFSTDIHHGRLAELRSDYGDEQVSELLLDLVRFRPGSKLVVATGSEPIDDHLVYT